VSDDEVNWRSYLADFHRERAGIAEAVLSRALAGDHSPYRWLARAVSVDAKIVVDLACGSGPMSRELAQPGRTVIGLDLSEYELALAADRGPGPWIRADALTLPFRDESVDVITSSMGLVVVTPLTRVVEEAARVLKPGGTVYVKDLFRRAGPLTAEQRAAMRNFDTLWGCVASPTLPDTVAAMTAAGLTDVATREYPHVDMEHYYRSMTAPGGGLNAFGEAFLHRDRIDVSAGLPVLFGEARARKPVGEPPPGGNIVGY